MRGHGLPPDRRRRDSEYSPSVSRDNCAKEAGDVIQADSLIDKITQLEREATRLGKKAEDAGDLRGAMAAVRELVRIVELLAKIQGDIKDPGGTTINVVYVDAPGIQKSSGAMLGHAESGESDEPAKSTIIDIQTSEVREK